MNRIYTRKSLLRRIASNRWLVTLLGFAAFFVLCSVAEGACNSIGAGIDLRVGAF